MSRAQVRLSHAVRIFIQRWQCLETVLQSFSMNWGNVSHSLLLKLLAFVAWLRALSISGRARNRTSALRFLCLLYFPQMALYKGNINNKQKLSTWRAPITVLIVLLHVYSVVADFSYPLEGNCPRTALHDVRRAQKLKDTHPQSILCGCFYHQHTSLTYKLQVILRYTILERNC